MLLLIDADSIVYAAAHCAERNTYAVTFAQGSEYTQSGLGYEEAKAAASCGPAGEGTIYKHVEVLPFETALNALRGMLGRTRREVKERFGVKFKTRILLTGSSNYRDRLAAVIRYKFNRVETQKPKHYGQLRKYLVDELGAAIIHWYEADDEIAISLTENKEAVASSIDKDLLQVPGWHHLPDKGFLLISEKSGLLRFYSQALCGDSTDGVPGCYRIGTKGARERVLEVAASAKSYRELERSMWQMIVAAYAESIRKYGKDKCGYDDAEQAALETARLVYLLRERPKDLANPPLWTPTK
jgi:hypothetical protein